MTIEGIIRGIVREEVEKALTPKNGPQAAVPAGPAPRPPAAPSAPAAPVPAPPSAGLPRPAPPAAPSPANAGWFTIKRVTLSQGAQEYLNIYLEDNNGRKAYLRFLMNASTEPTKTRWHKCLSAFIGTWGLTGLTDTDELVGRVVPLCGSDLKSVASVARICAALNIEEIE